MTRPIGEYLEVEEVTGKQIIRCKKCGQEFCAATENYKNFVLMAEKPLASAGGLRPSGGPFVLREFYCPTCATMLDVEMVLKDQPIIWDIQLKP